MDLFTAGVIIVCLAIICQTIIHVADSFAERPVTRVINQRCIRCQREIEAFKSEIEEGVVQKDANRN